MAVAPISEAERDFRGPGCTEDCRVVAALVPGRFGRSELLLHDPSSHEAYGRLNAGPNGEMIVWTGPLVINRTRRTMAAYGALVPLTVREWELLDALAGSLDRHIASTEILRTVWGPPEWYSPHILRTSIARLREKLGAHAHLIETRLGFGYRLIAAPPIEAGPDDAPVRPLKPWAQRFERCVCCGTTDRRHMAHGRCQRCHGGGRRGDHIGPCGRPPLEAPNGH